MLSMKNLQEEIQTLLSLYKNKNLSKAEMLGKELLKNHPNVVFLYNILGLVLNGQNKTNEAIECLKKGIKIKPDYAEIYDNLGSIYKFKGFYIEAENYYKKAININNKIPEPQNNLGTMYLTLNKYEESIIKGNLLFLRSHIFCCPNISFFKEPLGDLLFHS